MVKPAWLTVSIFCLQQVWNNHNMYVYTEMRKPLPALLNSFLAGGMARTGMSSAAALILLAVPVAAFIAVQSNVIETMSTSGIKE
jgi:ABC-type glycerol-3-phosphate transport system permease component